MRRIKITISTVWTVNDADKATADVLLKEQPKGTAHDYMEDARHFSPVLEIPKVKWEEIGPTGTWTLCSCGHIAQSHDHNGKCGDCACLGYDGKCT